MSKGDNYRPVDIKKYNKKLDGIVWDDETPTPDDEPETPDEE